MLELYDPVGNGWNNGFLNVEINGVNQFSLTLNSGFGPETTPIALDSGDVLNLIYQQPVPLNSNSTFDSYRLLDQNGNVVIEEISNDSIGPPSSYGIVACENFSDFMENPLENIMVYPNPTNKIININSNIKFESISLYNALGVLIYNSKKASKMHQIDISTFSPNY